MSVGNGESIRFWEDDWISDAQLGGLEQANPMDSGNLIVVDFISKPNHAWDVSKLKSCTDEEIVQAISKIPISLSNCLDKQDWKHSKNGKYSVKLGYFPAKKSAKLTLNRPSCSYTSP